MRAADYFRLLLLAAIWGASFLFMRIAAPALGSVTTAFLRVLLGCIGLGTILLVLKLPFHFAGKLTSSLLLGAMNSGLPFLMYCFAAQWLPIGYSAILNATTPLMGAVIGLAFFEEKLSFRKGAGVVLGLFGIMVITTLGNVESTGSIIAGVIACLVATGCYGTAGFLTRRWISERGGLDAKRLAFGSQVGATLFLLPFFIWSQANGLDIDHVHGTVWVSVVALGLVCTAFAYILYFRLINDVGPFRSLTVTFLIPPFSVLWGYLVLGETVSTGFFAGAMVVCIAVWMVVSQGKETRKVDNIPTE